MPGICISIFCDSSNAAPNGAPSDLILTSLSSTSIRLDWTIGSTNHDGHSIERSTDGVNYTEIDTVTGATATFTDTGLTSGTYYYYRVRAYRGTAYSDYSNVAATFTYTLFDDFVTDDAAPLTTPHVSVPGPGSFTVVDTNNHASISDNKLNFTGARTADGDPRLYTATLLRKSGRILKFTVTSANVLIGFGATNSIKDGVCFYNSKIYVFINGQQIAVAINAISAATEYDISILQRRHGIQVFISGGAFVSETLIYSFIKTAVTDNVTVYLSQFMGTGNTAISNLRMFDVGGIWGKRFPNAIDHHYEYSTTQSFIHTNNCIIEGGVIMASSDVKEIFIRRADANNAIICRITENGASGSIKLIEISSGVENEIATKTYNVITGTYLAWMVGINNDLIEFAFNGTAISATSTLGNTITDGLVDFASSGVAVYSRATASPSEPSVSAHRPLYIYAVGDSRTVKTGDSTLGIGWQGRLANLIDNGNNFGCYSIDTGATSGDTVAQCASRISTYLSACVESNDYALIDIGVNDILGTMPSEGDFKTNYMAIIDAIRAKWSGIRVYCAYVWARNQMSDANTVANWIDDIIATYSSNVYAGIDERTVIEGGDDGATNTTDGTHYSDAGFNAVAAAWKTALGY